MKTKLGIDPGLSGAIALMSEDNERIIANFAMPCMTKPHGTGNQVDGLQLFHVLDGWLSIEALTPITMAYIERVSARPGQGVTSMFSFGHTVGIIEGVLSSLQIPITWVLPTKWKRAAGLLKADKDASRTMVLQMYPELREALANKKYGQALSDAILIARFGQ